ncbi:phosphoglycerate mutase [Desulfonatronum thiosulfatophilum]|uniref:Phosphoglycerate mutase n=1 Tax=Desulfonatronum thiosulfatophilum TaxID=617002 RepID=A0A1G6DVR4_9BACT|nr:alkaline phosphatase family protein [Desulfonatronum thiosulfatophilum]SDB49287.1 phosphoglycerate mutase [Desulfonatronum thiosulfatophilum]
MPSKCLLIVLDGLGDRSHVCLDHRTPLQAAHVPNMDRLSASGANGLYHAGMLGECLPSETAHWAMFGYDRADFPGRGVLEALGAGVEPVKGQVAVLAHFVSLEERDGCLVLAEDVPRAEADDVRELIAAVAEWEHGGVRIRYVPVKSVFGVLIMSGNVSPKFTDTGPMRNGRFIPDVLPLAECADNLDAQITASALRSYLLHVRRVLGQHPLNVRRRERGLKPINGIVTQRAGRFRPNVAFSKRCGLRGLSIASGAVFHGLARYLGLDILPPHEGGDMESDFARDLEQAREQLERYDFIHLHTKAPDEAAHAKDPVRKMKVIEALDRALGSGLSALTDDPEVLIVLTADHSTPSSGDLIHSGEPVPLIIHGRGVRRDMVRRFDEIHTARGCLGSVRGTELMRLILNHLDKARLEGVRDTPEDRLCWPGDYQPLRF